MLYGFERCRLITPPPRSASRVAAGSRWAAPGAQRLQRVNVQRCSGRSPSAVEMGKRRMALLSDEEKSQLDKLAAKARKKKLSPEERTEIARKTGKAGGRGRKKAA